MLGSAQLEMTNFVPCLRFELRFDEPGRPVRPPVAARRASGPDPLEAAALREIEAVTARLAGAEAGQGALKTLWTLLVDALAGRERDPGLELAAVDLYEAAAALQAGADARRSRLLHQAAARFRTRLAG